MSRLIIDSMLSEPVDDVDFVVNGLHHGRGKRYICNHQNLQHVTTSLVIWRIENDQLQEIASSNVFLNSESYLIQWNYTTVELRTGQTSKNSAFFYWKGEKAPKGACPLPAHAGDAPVERIVQWSEPPVYLNLFEGKLIVYDENNDPARPRLFMLRGELPTEVHLFEVALKKESLRSRTCFVLHPGANNWPIIWYGAKATNEARRNIQNIMKEVFGRKYDEVKEGDDLPSEFQMLQDGEYHSLVEKKWKDNKHTPRMFYLCTTNEKLYSFPVENAHRSDETCPFPLLQNHLYSAQQPALFILDDCETVWLWAGFNPDGSREVTTEYVQANELAMLYAKEQNVKHNRTVSVKLVHAGSEPLDFTNVFPTWTEMKVTTEKRDPILFYTFRVKNAH